MKWYITNEAHSADLVMIISYPASPSRIIVLLKTLRHIIDNLKKKSERKERSFREKRRKGIIFLANAINNQRLLRATSLYEFEPIWSKLKLTSYSRCFCSCYRHFLCSRAFCDIFPFHFWLHKGMVCFDQVWNKINHHSSRDRTPFWICPSSSAYTRLCTIPEI